MSNERYRSATARRPVLAGGIMGWCSPRRSAHRSIRRTSAATSATPSGRGRPGSCRLDATRATASLRSLLSDTGTPIEEIARLVGHSSTAVTELVYRQQIRPVLQSGAVVMDRIFGDQRDA